MIVCVASAAAEEPALLAFTWTSQEPATPVQVHEAFGPYGWAVDQTELPRALPRNSYSYVPLPPDADAVKVIDVPGAEGLAGLGVKVTPVAAGADTTKVIVCVASAGELDPTLRAFTWTSQEPATPFQFHEEA
ncbi:MAG: hypothetical protein C3F14_04545, partial [Deltaproteobacteria bacterium]